MWTAARTSIDRLAALADSAGAAVEDAWTEDLADAPAQAMPTGAIAYTALADSASAAVEQAWAAPTANFDHVLSVGGESIVDYAALEGRAAPLPDYAKLLRMRAMQSEAAPPLTGFAEAYGSTLRPGRTGGAHRAMPERRAKNLPDSPTDLYTERPIYVERPVEQPRRVPRSPGRPTKDFTAPRSPARATGRATTGPHSSARASSTGRTKAVPTRSTARSHAAREQVALDNERDALTVKAAYQSEINAARRNVAADRAAAQAADRRVQAAARQVAQVKGQEGHAAAAAAAAQKELALEREMRTKAEARARVLSQQLAEASKTKAKAEAGRKAQEREKTLAAARETRRLAKGQLSTMNQAEARAKRGPETTEDGVVPLETYEETTDTRKWATPRETGPRQIAATVPSTEQPGDPEAARQRAAAQEARTIARTQHGKPKGKTARSNREPRREPLKPAVPQATGSYEPDRGDPERARRRAVEQEARAVERLRASVPDRAQQYVPYEYMPEGGCDPDEKKPALKKKRKKKCPKQKVQSRPLPDYSAVPPKVSTRGQRYTPRESGDDVVPTPERVVRRAVEQEARAVERLRTRPKRASGLDDQAAAYFIEPANKDDRKPKVQKNILRKGAHEERRNALAQDARDRARRYKSAVSRLATTAQAVDGVEREHAAERQRQAREKDNGVNARDGWRVAGPVRLDPDGKAILEGPDVPRPRARSAPIRPRPAPAPAPPDMMGGAPPLNTSPPGYIKRMQQRDEKAKASRPVGIAAWKGSLRGDVRDSLDSDGEPRGGKYLRRGGGHRADMGKQKRSGLDFDDGQDDPEDERLAEVLPGKVKTQQAKWAHVPSRIRGQRPWQDRAPLEQPASTEGMEFEFMFEVGADDGENRVAVAAAQAELLELPGCIIDGSNIDFMYEIGADDGEHYVAVAAAQAERFKEDEDDEDDQWARYADHVSSLSSPLVLACDGVVAF